MRVTVVGGGVAGLAAAAELVEAGIEVTVLESGDRFGGQVRTTREEGFVVEDGADTFGAESRIGTEWAGALDIADEIVQPADLPTMILLNGALDRLASGGTAALLGVPEVSESEAVSPCALRHGMESLIQAATDPLADLADLRSGTSAVALAHEADGWRVYPEIGSAIRADALLLALPPKAAAWLVHPVHPEAARHLTCLTARSVVVVSLGFDRDAVAHPLDASGFTVPLGRAGAGLQACTFASSHFPARAPEGSVLLRAVVRPARGELASTTDMEWAQKTTRLLEPVLGIRQPPRFAWVSRWPEAVPEITERATTASAAARDALNELGPVELAGAAFEAPGIDGAIRSGRRAADRLLDNGGS